jgi:hypothetical protein
MSNSDPSGIVLQSIPCMVDYFRATPLVFQEVRTAGFRFGELAGIDRFKHRNFADAIGAYQCPTDFSGVEN